MRLLACLVASTLAVTVGSLESASAQRGPEKVFAGKVLTSEKRYPTEARSASAYIAALRKQSKSSFREDKAKQAWVIHFAAFFKQALNDVEVTVKLYDISDGGQALLSSFDQFMDERGQRTLISQMKLERKQFGVNKQLLMTVETRGRVLASGKFKIVGEAERYSGKVDFSAEEASGGSGNEE